MNLEIAGKNALVTGASQGLGKACALALAREGVNIVISARGEKSLNETADEIAKTNVLAHPIAADITAADTPDRLVKATIERLGGIDILVGNAGGPPAMRALEVDDTALAEAVNANLASMVRLVRAAAPYMKAARWGRICLIASSSAKEPIPGLALSNIARTGLWAWAKTAAQDLSPYGITLNLACPGYHATDRLTRLGGTPKGMLPGDPAKFGEVVAFLCGNQAEFISGTALQVDGTQSVHGLL
jgi:3-oxoacyl-[acyl-carrier protein] reductase